MTQPLIEIEPVSRSSLYHGQYLYSVHFCMNEAQRLSYVKKFTDPHALSRFRRKLTRWVSWSQSFGRSGLPVDVQQDLLDMVELLTHAPEPFRIMTCQKWFYIYTNNLAWARSLVGTGGCSMLRILQARVDLPQDRLVLRRSKGYQYRTWFRDIYRKKGATDIQTLVTWVRSQPDVHVSQSFGNDTYLPIRRHHYIDHNDPKLVLMMELVRPRSTRKTQEIQVRED